MTLFRTSDIMMVLLMLCTAFWTYEVKYEAQRRYQEVRGLERKIEIEQDTANLLRARWALATEPARIARLARQYYEELQLQIIQPRQIATLGDIPQRLPDAIETAIKDSDALLAKTMSNKDGQGAGGLDNVATGSVKPAGAGRGNGGNKGEPGPQKKIAATKISKTETKRKGWLKQPPYIMPGKSGAMMPAGGKTL